MIFYKDIGELNRQKWLKSILAAFPTGQKILDAGAGEKKNSKLCDHLNYTSQDFCQYAGLSGGAPTSGIQNTVWDTSSIDIVSDIRNIPVGNAHFDAVLCSEVLEHIPDPLAALDEFARILKINGKLIITAPFSSNVHMAPYYFQTGFSRYWYEYHLEKRGFKIEVLDSNGDWYDLLKQELARLGSEERENGCWLWPLAYVYGLMGRLYFKLRPKEKKSDLASLGWNCLAKKII